MSEERSLVERLDRYLGYFEGAILAAMLIAMMGLAVLQIVLREFFNSGLVWADEFINYLVLWVALVASIVAARSNKHLRIDAISQFVPERFAKFPRIVVDLFAAGVCAVIGWHAQRYIVLLFEFGDTRLGDVPAGYVFGLLPFAMYLMALIFTVQSIARLVDAIRNPTVEAPGS